MSIRNLKKVTGLFLLFSAVILLLAGCGDGEDGDETSSSAPIGDGSGGSGGSGGSEGSGGSGGSNSAPTISGDPPRQILTDMQFSFTPTASDPDGDTLTFSATNLPSWASINASAGTITGMPESGDVGTYSNIRITVSDGAAEASTPDFSIEVVVAGDGSALLNWTPPTKNTDGSSLTDLNSYKLFWGLAPGDYVRSVEVDEGITSYLVEGLTPGTWYFAAKSINDSLEESTYSNLASKDIP